MDSKIINELPSILNESNIHSNIALGFIVLFFLFITGFSFVLFHANGPTKKHISTYILSGLTILMVIIFGLVTYNNHKELNNSINKIECLSKNYKYTSVVNSGNDKYIYLSNKEIKPNKYNVIKESPQLEFNISDAGKCTFNKSDAKYVLVNNMSSGKTSIMIKWLKSMYRSKSFFDF